MSQNWYYTKDGKSRTGPVTAAQLKELARNGQLQPTDMVKREDMPKWLSAGKVEGLFQGATAAQSPTKPTAAPPADPRVPPPAEVPTGRATSGAPDGAAGLTGQARVGSDAVPFPQNPVWIGLSLLFCLPVGLYLVWNHPGWTKSQKKAWTWAIGVAFVFLLIVAAMRQKADRKNLEEANRLWEAGEKSEAVAKYRSVIDGDVSWIDRSQRPAIFQRLIEFEAENGNTSAAKALIQRAVTHDVALSLNSPAALALLAEFQAEREQAEREAKVAGKPSDGSGSRYSWGAGDSAVGTKPSREPDDGGPSAAGRKGAKVFTVKVGSKTVPVEVSEGVAEEIDLQDLVYNKRDWRIDLKVKLLKPVARRYTKWGYTLYDKGGVVLASSELIHPSLGVGQTGLSYVYLGPDNQGKVVRITLP